MNRTQASRLAAAAILVAVLYLSPIHHRGLVGPDEPRYASVARQMAESGDWVTPVLWGEPWFEKPALLFWLGGLAHKTGIENYTRVPVALLGVAFLFLFFRGIRGEFDEPTAATATAILATSAGWVAYSDAGVFDAPVAVFTSAALLSLLPWVRSPDSLNARRCMPAFGALLGLGVLSKGLVAPAIAALALVPALYAQPRRALDLLGLRALVPFAAVCLPWYLVCYWRNGGVFVEEFIVRHHWDRFISPALQHEQPIWFYVPVLLAFLLPWAPLLCGLRRDTLWGEPRLRFLCAWTVLPFVFFSVSVNKLPAYILPVLPPLAILLAVQWRQRPKRLYLCASACTLLLVPLAGALLPAALADGITRAWDGLSAGDVFMGIGGAIVGAAVLSAVVALRVDPQRAVTAVGMLAAVSLVLLKFQVYPAASELAGTREFVERHSAQIAEACVGDVRRHVAYGIRHYSTMTPPPCEEQARKFRIEGDPPRFVANADRQGHVPDKPRNDPGG